MRMALPPASTSSSARPDQSKDMPCSMFWLARSSIAFRPWPELYAGSGRTVDFGGAEQVEVVDHLRARGVFQRDDVAERHQAVGIGTNVVLPQVRGRHAEGLVGLHVHAVGAIVEIEIVDVLRSHVDAKCLRDLTERHAHGLGLLAIDLHQLLRIVGGEAGEEPDQVLALAAGRQRFCAPRHPGPASVLRPRSCSWNWKPPKLPMP